MRIINLGRRGPGGDRVLCKNSDVPIRHLRLSGLALTMVNLAALVYNVNQWLSGRV